MNMTSARQRGMVAWRYCLYGANVIVGALLVGTVGLVVWESTWVKPRALKGEEAFLEGTIGTELMPLSLALVLSDIAPNHFLPGGKKAGDWPEQFGFLRYDNPEKNYGLPLGFAVSDYRPRSGAPSPVKFAGLSCGLCHTAQIRETENESGMRVKGAGSNSLNILGFFDAFQAAIMEHDPEYPGYPDLYNITPGKIIAEYEKKTKTQLTWYSERPITWSMLWLWLGQIRKRIGDDIPRFDDPYGEGKSRQPDLIPSGPGRTQPFRAVVRLFLNRPGNDIPAYSKLAAVFSQDLRERAQFDGAVAGREARSAIAAVAAGATPVNLKLPEIEQNIKEASQFTSTLRAPRYDELFPQQAQKRDAEAVTRGHEVYRDHCKICHGDRDSATNGWTTKDTKAGQIFPIAEIGTDPVRVTFRHYGELAERLYQLFPDGHPFHFDRQQILPSRSEENNEAIRGYISAPLDGVFLRAPYLHNASVLTLAELINLKKRRDVFYRGSNTYDPVDVGYRTPIRGPFARGYCLCSESEMNGNYFKFYAGVIGNSNRGHDYPWEYDSPYRDVRQLTDLLEYLKTL